MKVVVIAVVIEFLSGIVPLAEIVGFTPFLLQLLALRLSTLLASGHPPSSNQSSMTIHNNYLGTFPQL